MVVLFQNNKFDEVVTVHVFGVTRANCPQDYVFLTTGGDVHLASINVHNKALSFVVEVAGILLSMTLDTLTSHNFISSDFVS